MLFDIIAASVDETRFFQPPDSVWWTVRKTRSVVWWGRFGLTRVSFLVMVPSRTFTSSNPDFDDSRYSASWLQGRGCQTRGAVVISRDRKEESINPRSSPVTWLRMRPSSCYPDHWASLVRPWVQVLCSYWWVLLRSIDQNLCSGIIVTHSMTHDPFNTQSFWTEHAGRMTLK